MSAIQLATAYVSLVVEAKGVASGIAKELGKLDGAAQAAGASAGKRLSDAFSASAKPDSKALQDALEGAKRKAQDAASAVAKARNEQAAATRKASDAEAAHEKAAEAVARAQGRAEDAARKVATAEKAHAEAVAKYGQDSSKAMAAEDRLVAARRKSSEASRGVQTALKSQESAQEKLNHAQRQAEASAHGVKAAVDAEKRALAGADDAARAVARATASADTNVTGLARAFNTSETQAKQFGTAADQAGHKAAGFGAKLRHGLTSGLTALNPFKGLREKAEHAGAESAGGFSHRFAGGIKGLGGKVAGLIGPALAGVGVAAIGKGALDVIGKAGELEQSIGAIDSVFKQSAGQMHAWAKTAADSVGLSRNEFNELGTLLGAQLKNGGLAMDQLAPKTNELIKLGSDLSSMFGGTTREAVEALSSALKGERDPIERYGVSLKQAEIDAKAAELGFQKVGNSFSNEAQQAATLALIMEQTKDAHGNFAKESDTYAHKVQVLQQKFADFTAGLGEKLLPVAMSVLTWIEDATPAFEGIGASLESLGNLLFGGDFTGPIFGLEEDDPVIGILLGLRQAVLDTVGVGELLWTGDFTRPLFGLEEDNPIIGFLLGLRQGIIDTVGVAELMFSGDFTRPLFGMEEDHPAIGAILQIREAFISLGDSFNQLVEPGGGVMVVLEGIVSGALKVWDGIASFLLPIFSQLWATLADAVANNLPAFQTGLSYVGSAFDTLGGIVSAVCEIIKSAWDAVAPYVLPIVSGLVTYLAGAFASLGQIIDGAMKFILAVITLNWSEAWDAVKQIWDGVAKWIAAGWEWMKTLAGIIFGGIRDGVIAAFQALSNSVTGIMDSFKNAISSGWEWLKTTVISFAESLWGGATAAFEAGVKAVGSVFNGLKELAKNPVKFVIETVINKGIIGGVNWLAEKVGLGRPLGNVPLPAGFARGGILPGQSSWRDGDDQLVPMRRGEGVIVSEALKDPFERRRLYALNHAAMQGVPLDLFRDRFDGHHHHGFATGGIIGFRGHRFTSLFASRIQAAEKMAGGQMHITQGGWRPRTSYSGSSHAGDALDITGGYHRFILPLRRVGIPTWDRAGKGNWVAHAHGVPLPSAGTAGGSAVWQAQDYLRGGDGLGGRDNGPRVGVDLSAAAAASAPSPEAAEASKNWAEKAWDFIAKAGQAAWDFFTTPLKMFNDAISGVAKFIAETPGGKFGEIMAKVPNIALQGVKDWLADQVGIPHFANGGWAPGGLALVGERGPELVELPRGSYVHPNHTLPSPRLRHPQAAGGAATYNITLHMPDGAVRNLDELIDFLRRLPLAVRQLGGQVSY